MKTVLGFSTIKYYEGGEVRRASFIPDVVNMHENIADITSEFKKIDCDTTDPEVIRENSEKVMANWFLGMQKFIDLAEGFDREKFKLVSRVVRCEKYPNSTQVKILIVEFSIEEISQTVSSDS